MNTSILSGVAALALALSVAPAAAQTVEFTLINESSYALHYFYTTPSSETRWGYDLLGSDGTLEAGYQGQVTIGDGSEECLYDFKFVMDTGTELVVDEVNICELGSYTITD